MEERSTNKKTYQESLKATSITALAQIVQIAVKMINTKFVAVLLGPLGVGTIGLFQSSISLISTISGLGLGSSAVRDVARAHKEGDWETIGLTIQTLRRLVWITGMAGAIFCLLAGGWLSQISFNSDEHSLSFRILGLMVLFNQVSAGQMALLQGLRMLKEMTLAAVIGTVAGLIFAGPIYWWLGDSGIVPALLVLSMVPVLVAYYFSGKLPLKKWNFSFEKFREIAIPMVKLGASTMLSNLFMLLALWLTRIIVQRKFGLSGVGQFQAGWGVTTIYLQMIFQAMGRDYYPRLSGIAGDNMGMNRLVNEQLHLALLLGTPLLLLAMISAPWIITFLYSSGFQAAISQLQWLAFGTLFKLISWPLGFILLALRKSTVYLVTESLAAALFLLLVLPLIEIFGMNGIGIAYSINYILYFFVVFFAAIKIINFQFDSKSLLLLIISSIFCLFAMYSNFFYPSKLLVFLSVLFSAGLTFFYFKELNQLTGLIQSIWSRFK